MDLLKGLPKGIFRGEERYGAQVDMCHFGLVGSGNPNPCDFRATHMAAATLRPPLTPLVVGLNEYCTWNAPPWFTWCSVQVVRPPKGRTAWAFTPICVMGRPWRPPPSFSVMVTFQYHLPPLPAGLVRRLLPPPGCPLRQPLLPLHLSTGRHRLSGPCPCCFCCSCCCCCLGCLLDEETRQRRDCGLGRTKETKNTHAITTAIARAITR